MDYMYLTVGGVGGIGTSSPLSTAVLTVKPSLPVTAYQKGGFLVTGETTPAGTAKSFIAGFDSAGFGCWKVLSDNGNTAVRFVGWKPTDYLASQFDMWFSGANADTLWFKQDADTCNYWIPTGRVKKH